MYINSEVLKDRINEKWDSGDYSLQGVIETIDGMVLPEGEWRIVPVRKNAMTVEYFQCTNCLKTNKRYHTRYCPNCGIHMKRYNGDECTRKGNAAQPNLQGTDRLVRTEEP